MIGKLTKFFHEIFAFHLHRKERSYSSDSDLVNEIFSFYFPSRMCRILIATFVAIIDNPRYWPLKPRRSHRLMAEWNTPNEMLTIFVREWPQRGRIETVSTWYPSDRSVLPFNQLHEPSYLASRPLPSPIALFSVPVAQVQSVVPLQGGRRGAPLSNVRFARPCRDVCP